VRPCSRAWETQASLLVQVRVTATYVEEKQPSAPSQASQEHPYGEAFAGYITELTALVNQALDDSVPLREERSRIIHEAMRCGVAQVYISALRCRRRPATELLCQVPPMLQRFAVAEKTT
jgi:hypothetical protein